MRYLPKNKHDTYNYANPSVSDRIKKMATKGLKKIFTGENLFLFIFYAIIGLIGVAIYIALLPFYLVYYGAIAMFAVMLVSG